MIDVKNIQTEIQEEEKKQALSIPAKRLREKLIPLKSKEEQTAKRWFWELLQNASDYNETVDVRLEINDTQVVFKHNGRPFSIQDVLNLISPDSGKDKDEVKKDNIGKFGSGLVSTHVLSSEIKVKGVFKSENEDKLYNFDILLDRSVYQDKDKLINSIETTKKAFREIDKSIDETDYTGFMTSFSYNTARKLPGLSSTMNVVEMGLEYIYEVLPYTLCFMPKVQSVEIIDNRQKATLQHYLIKRKEDNNELQKFVIKENDRVSDIEFVKIIKGQVETVYRHEHGVVKPLPEGISKLFCGLPMIGSENIGLPFLLNSLDFEPTLEREGVEITPNDTQNRILFKQAVDLYRILLNDIANKKLDNAFYLTKLSNKFNGAEGSKNMFRRDFVPEFRKVIESSRIVKNSAGDFILFSEMLLPYKDGKPFTELYNIAGEIKQTKFPTSTSFDGWVNTIDFVLFPKQKYDLNQFVAEISQTTQIQAFVLRSGIQAVEWLRNVVSLVNEENELLFSIYAILLNQKGYLKKKNELFLDKDIPDELKNIYNKLHTEEIENSLLDKSFNDFSNVVEKTIDIYDISKKIDDLLKEKYTTDKASTASFSLPLNDLFKWINNSGEQKRKLADLFPWFYRQRAVLFMDSFGEKEKDYAFTIVQSGKMKELAALAKSELTPVALDYIAKHPEIMSKFYAFLQEKIDDKVHADSETGTFGEELVYLDLKKKYKQSKGYEIIWASKKGENRFDFEVKLEGKTVFYVDAKTTIRGISNSDSIPFFMRNSQWEFLPKIASDVKYLIARVFKKDEIIKYLQIKVLNGVTVQ